MVSMEFHHFIDTMNHSVRVPLKSILKVLYSCLGFVPPKYREVKFKCTNPFIFAFKCV